jgi:UDP-N-acetylglucosamine 2-epimerase (non-hydrolysing)
MSTPTYAVVLGTRPEIIKLAPVLWALRESGSEYCVIHTNQHYSPSLDADFFEELRLRAPDVNLGIGSDSHGVQTGRMLASIEAALLSRNTLAVIVQGDTNTTLAGALAAAKLHIPVAHVEAGLRSYDRRMPEEVNRRLVDHVADQLFPPTQLARENLLAECVAGEVSQPVGNTIVDAVMRCAPREWKPLHERRPFILLTLHRAENVDDAHVLEAILTGVESVAVANDLGVVLPLHPRTSARIAAYGLRLSPVFDLREPISFTELLRLQAEARIVMTDSGGLQEESCILRTPCVTLRTTTERPETVKVGANRVAGVDPTAIFAAAEDMLSLRNAEWAQPFGDGRSGERIASSLPT